MKKWFIIFTALVMVMLLAACGGGRGGDDSAHPYSWKEKNDGSIQLTIKNAPEDGFSWSSEGADDGLLQVERTDNGKKEKAVFTVEGQGFGGGTISFVCRRDVAPNDASFKLTVTFSTSEKGRLKVDSAECTEFPAAGTAGEDGKASCTWYMTGDDTAEIYLANSGGEYDWRVMGNDSGILEVTGPTFSDDGCTYSLTGVSEGSEELLLYDTQQGYGFKFSVSVAEDMSVDIAECEAGGFRPDVSQIPGMSDVTALVGEILFPDDINVLKCVVGNWYGGEEEDYARIKLQAEDVSWNLIVTKSYSVQKLIELCCDAPDSMSREEITIGGFDGVICSIGESRMLFWQDNSGRTFALGAASSETEISRDTLLNVAENLRSAQKKGA